MIDFGTVRPGTTLYIPFATYDSNDPSASVTLTGLAVTDVEIYKDGSATQRASDAGYSLLDTDGIDFDGITGIHGFSVDLADNTTANFYEAGSQYWVIVSSITVDAATINFIAATFRIGYEAAVLDTTIATLSSQTSFTLEDGSADDDAYNGMWCWIHDLASGIQVARGIISDYTGSTKTVTLAADPGIFTMAAGDSISVMGPAPLQPATPGRTLNIDADSDLPWNADWDAEVESECNDALVAQGLDHLLGASVAGADITDDSIVAQLVSASATADWDDFDNTTDSMQAIRDRGDAAWITGSGTGLTALASGTAQGGTASTIQLASGETFADDELNGNVVKITSGTGAGQSRLITDYTGSTDTATVTPNWTTNPDATSVYEVVQGMVDVRQIEGSDATDQIGDSVWDEDIEAAHGTDATAGLLLRALGQNISNETKDANLLDQLRKITAVVEHQRGAHTHQPVGDIFFVDPANGDTHASGNRGGISDPYSTVQDCHDNAVTSGNHDMIMLLAGTAPGTTTLTEDVTISKNYVFIRGPGRDFIWTRSGSGDTITVTGNGVELSGFQLNTAATGSGNGITGTSCDFLRCNRLWINDTRGDAIELTDCDNFVVEHCSLQGSGASGSGHGIAVIAGSSQTGNYGVIRDNYINDVQGDGIQIDTTGGGTVDATLIENNVIQGCTDDGIDIVDSGCTDTFIRDNRFGNNTSDDIEDAGTNTILINNRDQDQSLDDGTATFDRTTDSLQAARDALTTHDGKLDTVDTNVDAVLVDTNELQGDWTDGGRLDLILDAIVADTNELQTDDVPGLIAALNDVSTSDVLTQVNAALDTAISELGVAAPTATPTLRTGLMLLYMALRNKVDVTATTKEVHNDAGTVIATKTLSDDGTTYSESEMA